MRGAHLISCLHMQGERADWLASIMKLHHDMLARVYPPVRSVCASSPD